jgi:adenylate cyclase
MPSDLSPELAILRVGRCRALEDQRIERKLSAIFAADVEGYSRLMGRDEVGTLRTLTAYRVITDRLIASHRGRIFNTAGDSILADFVSAVDAVQCAVTVHEAITKENSSRPAGEQMRFRIGIHVGDIIVQGDNLFGDAVNIAARLEALAEPGGICVSGAVRDQIRDKLPYALGDMSEQQVKNIARPVRVYSVDLAASKTSPPTGGASDPGGLATPRTVPRLSIVVLPFANQSNDPEQEYFADGITDDLTTDLSRISGSFVIARNTAFTYKSKPVDAKQVGRELGVRYVLEGSVRRTGDRVRVNVQLIDAENGAHIWADRIDTDRSRLMETQDEITGRLAWTLNIELLSDISRQLEREKVINPDARDLVMRGWAWYYRPASVAAIQEALQAFEHALEIDPRSIQAKIGIARALVGSLSALWTGTSFQQDAVQQDVARAEQLLFESLECEPNLPMAYAILGLMRRMQNRLAESRIAFERAITLDPNFEWANMQLGWTLLFLARPAEASGLGEKCLRLSPRDPSIFWRYELLGWCQLVSSHVDEAIDFFIKARTANPRIWNFPFALAGALALKGDLDGGRAALAEFLKLNPEVNSLAKWYAVLPWTSKDNTPQFWALQDKTLNEGLRRIGFPEE